MIIMDVSVMLLSTHLSKFLTFIVFLDKLHSQPLSANARLRGWQRLTQNSNTTTVITAAQWDWKRHALTVPLEAFVMCVVDSIRF
ncbi:Hypothetical protein VCSRO67_3465 [Vibrio cholerae]|nr:Hypothetical protein VCSRO67_3465 [Vibrio cholerae]